MQSELEKILILPSQPDYQDELEKLTQKKPPAGRFAGYDSEGSKSVLQIIRDVAERGDDAVAECTFKFDGVRLQPEQFRISDAELKDAHRGIDRNLLKSIRQAIENVRQYQSKIFIGKDKNFKSTGIKYTPIKRVGICVPGASAPLPSTVIMTAVPAQVAGVKEIAVVSPPKFNGTIHPVILAFCHELKIKEVYRIGGAQAIAALAAGTRSIKKVDKIVGPGNQWVQHAKKMVAGDYVAIDSIAGPSEVLIIANKKSNPSWIAADMLSQAEHASDGIAVALTDSEYSARMIIHELEEQLKKISRSKYAIESLLEGSAVVVLRNMKEVIHLANKLAAEHLQIECGSQSKKIADKIENAGAIFIGDYSPVAVGDYWAGPSHTLPTEMRAKFSSALTSNDFIKSISIIEYDKKKLEASAEDIIRLAEAEGLDAHARSVRIRINKSTR